MVLARDPVTGCKRWPENLRLRSSQGEVVRGRCRSTNLCEYCATLAAVETSEMLALDATEDAPTILVVLTARELLERRECRRHLEHLRRGLRRTWPDVRWAVTVEFQKRGALHLNLLVKGVPTHDTDEFGARIVGLWCSRVDAAPQGQYFGEIATGEGVIRYVSRHFQKRAQAPPIGWRGHRVSYCRDYLVRPAAVMRQEARRSLQAKRELRRQIERGMSPMLAEAAAAQALAIAADTTWSLVESTA